MEQTKTADAILERGYFTRIGLLPIYVKPLTLGQVIEIGELSSLLQSYDTEEASVNIARYAFNNSSDVEIIQEVAIIAIFRSKIARKLFGWYIRRNMNTNALKKCFKTIHSTFDYAFFFTSSLFLREMKKTVGMENKETPRGDSWVEQ